MEKTAKKPNQNDTGKPAPARVKRFPDISEIVSEIRGKLVSKGTYSANLESAIFVAATNYLALLHIQRDVARGAKTYYIMTDANGNKIPKIRPEYAKLPDITTSAMKALRGLGLTLDTLIATDDDPLDKLMNNVASADED